MRFILIDDDGSDNPKTPVKGAKVKITLSDGSSEEAVSGPDGSIAYVDLDPGNCSVELNEDEDSDILELTGRWPVSNLATKKAHKIGVIIRDYAPFSG